jgi:3-hydroxybutyryl-CoA dehydrogenase
MSSSGIQKIGVLGIGTMGSGIAQVSATSGFDTIVVDVNEEVVNKGLARIHKSLDKLVASYEKSEGKRGITQEHRDESAARLKGSSKVDELLDRDIIIEAVFEDYDVKAKILQELEKKGFDGKIATNTSSISITRLASNYHDPTRFMGMHFMNPVPIQVGVEIIRGLLTGDEMYNTIVALCGDMGKTPIPAEDKAGFGINRMFIPFVNEAARVVEEGIMSVEDADKTTLCLGHRMGPITTMDYVGLDVCVAVCDVLEAEFGSPYKATALLKRLVEAGYLGMKSGKGFYIYEKDKDPYVNPAVARYRIK